ncbi:acyl-CoA dehydrogenase family protein [bacterium]|nr:acyl-CoA dehydrogenase family protein [bacterium]
MQHETRPETTPAPKGRYDEIRAQLDGWRANLPDNFYTADTNLRSSLRTWLGDELAAHEERLANAGADAATALNEWAKETNRDENLPHLRRFDGNGNRTEQVVFHPAYHDMGRKIYGSGVMSLYGDPGQEMIQLALFYLFAQNGESGHCCPLACTAGAIKLLMRAGADELKDRFLPRLLDPNYDTHLHACQFLTELQGGSDVGANECVAVPQSDGSYRIYGEKWFCSVIDAGLIVLSARPEGAGSGTRGLTTFVAPRTLPDGSTNDFAIKRLKYKLGTRSMASAEIDLNGLVAYAVGEPGEGFKYVVDIVLNTSRVYNAFASAGLVRRAYMEALAFAKTRTAFGTTIIHFPLVKRAIAMLRTESAAQIASSLHVTHLAAKISAGEASETEQTEFRFLVNANKYWTSIRATFAVRQGIEVLGGNGAIEEFTVMPRLLRDSLVFESWEGTHNVLSQQVLKDMARYKVHAVAFDQLSSRLDAVTDDEFSERVAAVRSALDKCRAQADELLAFDPIAAQLHVRTWLDRVMAMWQAADLLIEAAAEKARGEDTGKLTVFDYHRRTILENADTFGNGEIAALEEALSA